MESPEPDERDAEIARLRQQLADAMEIVSTQEIMRGLVASHDKQRTRRIDKEKLGYAYELIEDHAKMQSVLRILETIWNKDELHRKASIHVSRFVWDLRQRLSEFL